MKSVLKIINQAANEQPVKAINYIDFLSQQERRLKASAEFNLMQWNRERRKIAIFPAARRKKMDNLLSLSDKHFRNENEAYKLGLFIAEIKANSHFRP